MIPDNAVEAAAKAIYESESYQNRWDWPLSDLDREEYRKHARAALEAAAPYLTATAAEKAMQDIKALMDEYFSDTSRIVEVDVCMRLARIVGSYDIERIGESE